MVWLPNHNIKNNVLFPLCLGIFLVVIIIVPNAFANEFGTIFVEKSVYEVSSDRSVLVKLYGFVENPRQGTWVEMVVTHPDDSISSLKVPKTSKGYFETYINVEYANRGNYSVSAEFNGNSIGTVTFEVTKYGSEAAEQAAVEAVKEKAAAEKAAAEKAAAEAAAEQAAAADKAESTPESKIDNFMDLYNVIVESKKGDLAIEKKHYIKKHPGGSITINVGVFIIDSQSDKLNQHCPQRSGLYQGSTCSPIYPHRIVIENQKNDLTKFHQDASIDWDNASIKIGRQGEAKIILEDPFPGKYFLYADSKSVGADYLPPVERQKDLSCHTFSNVQSYAAKGWSDRLPDCYQNPVKDRLPGPSTTISFNIDLDKNYKLKPSLSFVDQTKDPSHYVKRYIYEPDYKEWFDKKFPSYTIYEAIGISQSEYVETKYELAIQEIEAKEAAEAAAAEAKAKAAAKAKQERDRVNFNNNLYGFFFSPDSMKMWVIVGIFVGVILLIKRKRSKTPKPARQDLDDYESKYLARQGQRPTRKPAEVRQTSSFCETCGNPLKPHYKFCNKCGSKQ